MPEIVEQISSIREQSAIRTEEDPRGQPTLLQKRDVSSIHFDLSTAGCTVRNTYAESIDHDLETRSLDAGDLSLSDRQSK